MKFGTPMRNDTSHVSDKIKSQSKPEVDFQYGGRLLAETGSCYISAVD